MQAMKTALITGISGGMGYATGKRLAAEGWQIFGLDLRAPEVFDGLRFLQADLTDAAAVERCAEQLRRDGTELDCIIHMAGLYDLNSLVEMPEEDFARIFQVNLFAAYRVDRCFLPLLKPGARIVLTTSELAPLDPLPFTGIYAITKTALEQYAESLRMELQLLGHPVIVLRPGAVDTGLLRVSTDRLQAFTERTKLYSYNAKRFSQIVDRVEARKIPPERIAALTDKALRVMNPKYVYKINRNPLLLLLNALPRRLQCGIIRGILREKKSAGKSET